MIKVKSFNTAQNFADYLNKEGLTVEDIEGLHMNASNFWTAFIVDDEPIGVIDTSAGVAGLSVSVNALSNGVVKEISLGTHRRTETEIEATTDSAYEVSQALTLTSTAPASVYVVPGSIEIESGSAPKVVDNGYGELIEQGSGVSVGTVTYTSTPTVTLAYRNRVGFLPSTTASATTINYETSAYPDANVFPDGAVKINRIVAVDLTGTMSTLAWELYGDSDCSDASFVSSGSISLTSSRGAAVLDPAPISGVMDLTASNRDTRWMKVTGNATETVAIFVWWEKVI
jgi:hypothetical protein